FFSSRRRHTRFSRDWSSDVCSSDLSLGTMPRTLLVTNDFPPRPGGIQSYLHSLATRLPAEDLVVYAPSWERGSGSHSKFDAEQPFALVPHPTSSTLPTAGVLRRARQLLRAPRSATVWSGATAPLAPLADPLRRAGASRVVASTHGHEVGWSMLPAARQALRRIGNTVDVVTFVSHYTRRRFASAFGPLAGLEHLPSGVDTTVFRPDDAADRKSTRLNSSHVKISYAVFCLKKHRD